MRLSFCFILVLIVTPTAHGQFVESRLTASDGTADSYFGSALSLSGHRLAIGAYRDSESAERGGAVYLFERDEIGSWLEVAKLTASDAESFDLLGYDIDLMGDRILVGAFRDNEPEHDSGSAYIFERNSSEDWIEISKLVPSDGSEEALFGGSVSLDGDIALISASWDDAIGTNSGSAYIFELTEEGTWLETAKLVPPVGDAGDYAGLDVVLADGWAFLGAPYADGLATRSGVVYAFKQNEHGIWEFETTLFAADGTEGNRFGIALAHENDRLIIGANGCDTTNGRTGCAYIFELENDEAWVRRAKLIADDGAPDDWFGSSVALTDEFALVGATDDSDEGMWSGSAYLFREVENNSWQQHAKLTASDANAEDLFGSSVALSSETAFVGALLDDNLGDESGSVYVYQGFTSTSNESSIATSELSQLVIYPNPTSDYLTTTSEAEELHILDPLGRIVLSGNSNTPIDISHLPVGIYFVKAENQTKMFTVIR